MLDDALFAFRGALFDAAGGDASVLSARLRATRQGLPVPRAGAAWSGEAGTAQRDAIAAVLSRAAADLALPWPQPLARDAARVHRDGDRDTWEQAAFARQHRLTRAALAAAVTGDDAWIDAVADGVMMLCEQTSWCWPAHDDVHARHGGAWADPDDPFVDLGAGEVVAQLAWIDHVLADLLEERCPGLRDRIRREAHLRIFAPFVARRDWHWIGLDDDVHNWNPWIHGNVLAAALALLDRPGDEDLRATVLALCVEGLDRYVTALPDDGAIDEGYAYWWNGACRALEALTLLAAASDGAIDVIATIPALRATVSFPHRTHLGGDWYLNLADGPARPVDEQPWHALFAASVGVADDDACAFALSHRATADALAHERHGCGRLFRALADTAWTSAGAASAPLPRDSWHPSTQVLLARERRGSTLGLAVAAKGGHNGENHNHNDVGSFVVASDGVPVLVDAGRPTYTAQTFGPDRYALWMMQSVWHNTPSPLGAAQPAGAQYGARAVVHDISDEGASLSLDLAGAYDAPIKSWRRAVSLARPGPEADRADAAQVSILDEWVFGADADRTAATRIHLLVAGTVEIGEASARISPVDPSARAVIVRWPAGVTATTTLRPLEDPMLSDVWGDGLTRVELDVSDRRSIRVTVEQDQETTRR